MAMQEHSRSDAGSSRSDGRTLGDVLASQSRAFLREVWSKAKPNVSSFSCSDAIFVLVGQSIDLFSGRQFAKALDDGRWLAKPFKVSGETYEVQDFDNQSLLVSASFTISPPDAPTEDAAQQLACILIWDTTLADVTGARLKFCQMTIADTESNAHLEIHTGVPTSFMARTPASRAPIVLRASDARGTTHWVVPDQVVYVSAAHQYTNVHCVDRLVRMRAPFGRIVDQLGGVVVQIHRSYAVNPLHASHLEGEELHLSNGTRIPIPARRIKEVRDLLSQNSTHVGARD